MAAETFLPRGIALGQKLTLGARNGRCEARAHELVDDGLKQRIAPGRGRHGVLGELRHDIRNGIIERRCLALRFTAGREPHRGPGRVPCLGTGQLGHGVGNRNDQIASQRRGLDYLRQPLVIGAVVIVALHVGDDIVGKDIDVLVGAILAHRIHQRFERLGRALPHIRTLRRLGRGVEQLALCLCLARPVELLGKPRPGTGRALDRSRGRGRAADARDRREQRGAGALRHGTDKISERLFRVERRPFRQVLQERRGLLARDLGHELAEQLLPDRRLRHDVAEQARRRDLFRQIFDAALRHGVIQGLVRREALVARVAISIACHGQRHDRRRRARASRGETGGEARRAARDRFDAGKQAPRHPVRYIGSGCIGIAAIGRSLAPVPLLIIVENIEDRRCNGAIESAQTKPVDVAVRIGPVGAGLRDLVLDHARGQIAEASDSVQRPGLGRRTNIFDALPDLSEQADILAIVHRNSGVARVACPWRKACDRHRGAGEILDLLAPHKIGDVVAVDHRRIDAELARKKIGL